MGAGGESPQPRDEIHAAVLHGVAQIENQPVDGARRFDLAGAGGCQKPSQHPVVALEQLRKEDLPAGRLHDEGPQLRHDEPLVRAKEFCDQNFHVRCHNIPSILPLKITTFFRDMQKTPAKIEILHRIVAHIKNN